MKYVTEYKEVLRSSFFQRTVKENVRYSLRQIALDSLSFQNKLINLEKYLSKPRIQFLYVHHVFSDELEKFESLLTELMKYHEFISYSDAVERIHLNQIDKPYIVLSTDDGFKNNLDAAKILDRYGIKGCFFVNPASIGLKEFKSVKRFCNSNLNFPATEFLTWKEIESLLKSGHEIGSHTMNHIDISKQPIELVEYELSESFQFLKSKCGSVNHFAYPFGSFSFFNKPAMDLVYSVGYKSCASAERVCHFEQEKKIDRSELLIRRDHIVCAWDLDHIFYFLISNSKSKKDLKYPY